MRCAALRPSAALQLQLEVHADCKKMPVAIATPGSRSEAQTAGLVGLSIEIVSALLAFVDSSSIEWMMVALCRQLQECNRCAELQQHIAASNAEFVRQQGQYEAETKALRHAMNMARAREAELAQQV